MFRKRRAQPKEEPPEPVSPERDLLNALNGLEVCIDWRQGNTDSNLILDDRKRFLFRECIEEYGFIPTFNHITGRWEVFEGEFH